MVGDIPIWKTKGPRLWLLTRHKMPLPGTFFYGNSYFFFHRSTFKTNWKLQIFCYPVPRLQLNINERLKGGMARI